MASSKLSARRSLRLRLLVLLLVPLLSLGALWAFAAYLTARDAIGKHEASTTFQNVAMPGAALSTTLDQERLSSAVLLSTHGRQGRKEVDSIRVGTDGARDAFRRSVLSPETRDAMSATTRQRLDTVLSRLDGLAALRAQIDAGTVDPVGAIDGYDAIVDAILHLYGSVVLINDPGIYQQSTAILSVSTAHEFMMREDSVISVALARRGQRMTGREYALFAQDAANGRYLFDSGRADLDPELRGRLDRLASSPDLIRLRALERSIVAGGTRASLAPKAQSWRSTVTPLMTTWPQAVNEAGERLTAEAKPIGDHIMDMLYAAAGFGAVAVLVSIVVSAMFGRNLARELIGLQRAALDLAQHRLPSLVKRLRAGEDVDVDAEARPIRVGRSKEVGHVASALTALQRTAVQAAIGEARLRQGINQVFLNLAWRNQSLLHRQLTMLDAMERQASDPDALEGLFALDHLTTRMRRHAEGLVILSGAAPARGWHNPVSVRDILRAAIAEVEDYTRVVVESASPAALDGGVVADVTHLLAELIENATAFSPPPTQVHVRGELTASGYTVEIEDRGIGMNEEELADANQRLSQPPEFDLADSDRLGLFIVGRLAERRGIGVRLSASPYGGSLAVVKVPLDYIVGDRGQDFDQDWPDDSPSPDRYLPAWRTSAPTLSRSAADETPVRAVTGPDRPDTAVSPVSRAAGPRAADAGPRAAGPVPDAERTDPGAPELPRRVRQANLVPQLRADTPGPPPVGIEPATTRPPEETRALMTSLQEGWQRGREEEDPDE
jgi:signal transduction histidine kinase